jgi:hypothetical protein
MTWNLEGILCSGRELALLNLLVDKDVDVMIIREAEMPADSHSDFNVEGYTSYLPHPSSLLKTSKYRAVTMVRSALAMSTKLRSNLMHALVQSVWIQLDIQGTPEPQGTGGPPGTRFLIGGLYREWSDLILETTALSKVREQLQAAFAETDNVFLAGDVNLRTARRLDMSYRRRCLMLAHDTVVAEANMRYLKTGITYRFQGRQVHEDGEAREHDSILDHMCVSKDLVATFNMINGNTMDHYQLLASVTIDMLPPSNKSIKRRNFKKVSTPALSKALETWPICEKNLKHF